MKMQKGIMNRLPLAMVAAGSARPRLAASSMYSLG